MARPFFLSTYVHRHERAMGDALNSLSCMTPDERSQLRGDVLFNALQAAVRSKTLSPSLESLAREALRVSRKLNF